MKCLELWECLHPYLKMSVVIPTCSYLSIISTPHQPNSHSYLLQGSSFCGPILILLPTTCLLIVLESEPFSNLLPRLGSQRFLTTPWLLVLFDMTHSPGQAQELARKGIVQINFSFN